MQRGKSHRRISTAHCQLSICRSVNLRRDQRLLQKWVRSEGEIEAILGVTHCAIGHYGLPKLASFGRFRRLFRPFEPRPRPPEAGTGLEPVAAEPGAPRRIAPSTELPRAQRTSRKGPEASTPAYGMAGSLIRFGADFAGLGTLNPCMRIGLHSHWPPGKALAPEPSCIACGRLCRTRWTRC